ncbi:hypothetical protein BGZ54_008311 [Gamsiella multidivaricata]|nr:hypothetical protein BGZ54_008311 [Gamsiella multidivaricata]
MQSPPIHRSESQETEDQQHLTRLARTQSRVDRLQQRAPSPLRIPHSSHNTASPTTPAAAMQPHLAPTSTTSTDTQAHVQPDAQRNQEGYIIPRPMSVPSRASTPTPPLPKRPDRVQSLCLGSLSDRANWRISSATLLEISVLDDLDDNYKNNNEGRTGALRDVEAVAEYLRSDNDKEYRQRGGSPVSESKSSQQQNGPPSPHLLQGPEAAYQQQLTRHTRQEQMLKRSSQVIPVHHKHQNQRQLKHNNRVPSQSTIGPEHQHTKERPESKVLTEEEIAKLEMLFQKKKVLHERFDDIGASSSTDDLLSSTASLHLKHHLHFHHGPFFIRLPCVLETFTLRLERAYNLQPRTPSTIQDLPSSFPPNYAPDLRRNARLAGPEQVPDRSLGSYVPQSICDSNFYGRSTEIRVTAGSRRHKP